MSVLKLQVQNIGGEVVFQFERNESKQRLQGVETVSEVIELKDSSRHILVAEKPQHLHMTPPTRAK